MKTQTHFFATRTLARNFLNDCTAASAKFKDFGKDAPAGERWAVLETIETIDPVSNTKHTEIETQLANALKAVDVISTDNIKGRIGFLNKIDSIESTVKSTVTEVVKIVKSKVGGIIGEQTLKSPNNKPVRVLWRRNMTATRLSHLLNNAA